ncbi:MAG: hypothetical protein VX341_01185 [Bdellovibrionota bacterium]|nr:hypothetical protein [Bdellovibrionota bacterium]
MKTLKVIFLLSFANLTIAITSIDLDNLINQYNHFYRHSGNDNNYLENIQYHQKSLDFILKDLKVKRASEIKKINLSDVLRECVFITKGAYGNHFNSKVQKSIIRSFFEEFYSYDEDTFKFYKITDIQFELINNNCSLIITDVFKESTIVIQGVSFD